MGRAVAPVRRGCLQLRAARGQGPRVELVQAVLRAARVWLVVLVLLQELLGLLVLRAGPGLPVARALLVAGRRAWGPLGRPEEWGSLGRPVERQRRSPYGSPATPP